MLSETATQKASSLILTGLIFFIASFGVGYRTIQITRYTFLHPAEVILWGTFLLLFFQKRTYTRQHNPFRIPSWLWLFMLFWIWAWFPGLDVNRPWDKMFAEFRNFLALLPLFWITTHVLAEKTFWRPVINTFFLTGTAIALLGLIETVYPGVSRLIPGYFTSIVLLTGEGFTRSSFSFWGTPAATFVLVLTLPFAIMLWHWHQLPHQRILTLGAVIIQAIGIYLGGYRSLWALLGLQTTIWGIIFLGVLKGIFLLFPLTMSYQFLPQSAQERALTLILAFEGRGTDTSAIKRMNFIEWSWDTIQQNPWGKGWAGAGWPHSDFLQVAVNMGVLAGLLFLGAWLLTLKRLVTRLIKLSKHRNENYLGWSLLLSFIAVGSLLGFQGVQVLPQLAFPVWFVWVLVDIWVHQSSEVER